MDNNLYKRLARAEAMTDAARAELDESLKTAYAAACKEGDTQSAAALARKIRKKCSTQATPKCRLTDWGLTPRHPLNSLRLSPKYFRATGRNTVSPSET